jgi:four helix bundle protein
MAVTSYNDLVVWQKAVAFVVEVYKLSRRFPREETYGLTNQVRRAAVSVPSNIAEGQGRGVGQAFSQHIRIAQGSLQEVETQLVIAAKLNYISEAELAELLEQSAEIGRLNRGLLKSL